MNFCVGECGQSRKQINGSLMLGKMKRERRQKSRKVGGFSYRGDQCAALADLKDQVRDRS